MNLRHLIHLCRDLLRKWLRDFTSARWVRRFVYLFGVLLLLIGGTVVGILRIQANEIDELTLVIAPAVEANDQVLQAMTDADSGLLGYQISHDLRLLTAYHNARTRTTAALTALQDKLMLSRDSDVAHDDAVDRDLENRQHLAVQQWWSYALSAEQAATQGDRVVDILQGNALFNNFRLANAAIGEHLKTDRDLARDAARAWSVTRMRQIIIATFAALVTALFLGLRYSRSVSQPIAELRDTMTRQREGDPSARANEDQGSLEIRSLAIDFNTLAENNLKVQRRVEDVSARMASLVDLGLALGQELDLNDLMIRMVESARTLFRARYAAIGMLNATGTGLAEFVTAGLSPEEKAAIGEMPQGKGLLGALIEDPQVLRLEHMKDDPRSMGFPPHHPPMDSFLGMPITIRGEMFGNLYLADRVDGSFTIEDEQVARAFALQAAIMVENVRRYEAECQRTNMLESVRKIEHAIHTMSDIQQALNVLCPMLGEGLGVDRVIVKTVDAGHMVLFGAQWYESSLGAVSDDLVLNVDQLAEKLWQSSGHIVQHYSHPSQALSTEEWNFHREIGAQAVIVVPIGLGERVLGMIYVVTVHQPRRWTKTEVSHIQQVAAFMAQFIADVEYRVHQSEYIERLERLEQQQTNFVATVSHELRTPLTSITGYLELLKDGYAGEVTGDQQQMFEVMDRNAIRLRKLIEDLLVLNQSERDGHKVDLADMSMHELITEVCRELPPVAQNRAIKLDINDNADPKAMIVNGDKSQLKNAVMNIVGNAIKFSRPGGVVTITCTLDKSTRRVRFTCEDCGIGIPAADQAQLFTRFFRASNATNQQIPGTGIGLVIAKQIIHDHGGQMRLASVEGEGTTVVIDLPLSVGVSS